MLRMIAFTLLLAVFVTGFASAEQPRTRAPRQFVDSAVDMPVIADDGSVQGRVVRAQRDARGHVVAATVEGLDPPADAPRPQVVAENAPDRAVAAYRRVSSVPAGTFSR